MSSRTMQSVSDQSLMSSVTDSGSRDASASASNEKASTGSGYSSSSSSSYSQRRQRLLWYIVAAVGVAALVWFFWDMIAALFGMHNHHHTSLRSDNWNDAPDTPAEDEDSPRRRMVENPFKNTTFRDNQFVDSYNARSPQAQ